MKKQNLKIAFFDTKSYDHRFFEQENTKYGYEIKFYETKLNEDSVSMAAGYDAVCVFVNDEVNEQVINKLIELDVKLIALRCAGYNNVNLYSAHNRIPVVRVPAYSPYAVAEHAVALLLTLNRKTHRAWYRIRENNYSISGLLGFDLHGKTIGVIGCGKIGRIFARIMSGFGMKILLYDMYEDGEFAASIKAKYTTLEQIYAESDVISLHCPLTPESRYMINNKSLAIMKDSVIIINTSRGHLINTAALIEALKSGKIGGAALDVYEEESDYFFEDKSDELIVDDMLARLNTFNNVLITSHQAFFTREALENITATTMRNIKDYFTEGKLENGICAKCDGQRQCPGKPCNTKCFDKKD